MGLVEGFFCLFFVFSDSENVLEQHIIVYNPLAWNISTYINISVPYAMAVVLDDYGKAAPAQVPKHNLCIFRSQCVCTDHLVQYFQSFSF